MTRLGGGVVRSDLDRFAHWDGLVTELATAVIVTDVTGRTMIWNEAATALFGWPAADVLGRPALGLLLPRNREVDAVAVLTTVAAGRRWFGELECKRRDGTDVPIHVTLSALYDGDALVIGFAAEARDLTDIRAARKLLDSTERLSSSLLMRTSEPAVVTDAFGVLKYVVPSTQSALGYTADEMLGLSVFQLVHDDDVERVRDAFTAVVADPALHPSVLYRVRAKNGSWRWREVRLSNCLDDPVLAGIVCNVTDVTDQQDLIRELRAADARQQAIVGRSRDATLFFDHDGTIRWASSITFELIGMTPETLLGQNGLDFIHPDDQERVFTEFLSMTELGDHVRTEFRITDLDGYVRWVEEDCTNLLDDPDVGYIVANMRDVTDRRSAQEQLERLALYDPLTGLPNRSLVVNRLEQLLTRGSDAAVLHIDIDNFGDVNDSLGHAAGDELLRLIGSRLVSAATAWPATLARVVGDHFVLLCDDVGDVTTAFAHAEHLRESLRSPVELGDRSIVVTASIGIALRGSDATGRIDATVLMRDAASATQQAKQLGRDRVIAFDARLGVTQQRRLEVQSELRQALARDELVVFYQPIVDVHTDRITSVEALVRWNHPERGLLGPEHFIDVAESSGLIRAIGSQVLRKACAQARAWQEGGRRLGISINAAAAELSSSDYVDEIEAVLREFGLDAGSVTIEITETAAMQVADSLDTLKRIRKLGVHLSLDDFGTGYSSLSFLRDLPVDAIKIDRSFISGLSTHRRDTSIVQGVVAMAAALGHAVVAEGIETQAQLDALRDLGCRFAQGFLWSRPVPAAEIEAVIQRIELSAPSTRS